MRRMRSTWWMRAESWAATGGRLVTRTTSSTQRGGTEALPGGPGGGAGAAAMHMADMTLATATGKARGWLAWLACEARDVEVQNAG